ncbi:MAG: DUF4129 domain-containing protein [Halopenitus sp.]
MDRDALLAVGVALLAVVALGVAAATIDTAVDPGSGSGVESGGGTGDGTGGGSEDSDLGGSSAASGTSVSALVPCQPWLRTLPVYLGLFGLFSLFFALTYRDTESLFASGVVAVSLFIPVGLFWYLFSECRSGGQQEELLRVGLGNRTNGSILPQSGGPGGGETAAEVVSTPTVVFGLLVVVAILASVVLLFTAGRDDEGAPESTVPDDEQRDAAELAAVGRTAGRAADRIEEDADVDNEVFRAWRDLTEHLDVDAPESSTPAEFADAAVDAGMDPEHVDALTEVFESVRYGGAEPTADRERRAVDALRAIEESQSGGAE